MKIQFLVGSLFMFTSLYCQADDWSVNPDQFAQSTANTVVLADSSSQSRLNISDAILSIMFDKQGVHASLSEQSWLSTADVDKSGLVIQRQRGALSLQYRF